MLVSVITTVLDNLWYEIWQELDGTSTIYTALRYDGELGNMHKVAVEWKEGHAERMIRYDMARLGIA